jgi:hypothetical protein
MKIITNLRLDYNQFFKMKEMLKNIEINSIYIYPKKIDINNKKEIYEILASYNDLNKNDYLKIQNFESSINDIKDKICRQVYDQRKIFSEKEIVFLIKDSEYYSSIFLEDFIKQKLKQDIPNEEIHNIILKNYYPLYEKISLKENTYIKYITDLKLKSKEFQEYVFNSNDKRSIILYIKQVLQKRVLDFEKKLLSSYTPELIKDESKYISLNWNLVEYARDVIKDRWPEFEKIILDNDLYEGMIYQIADYYRNITKDDEWSEIIDKYLENDEFFSRLLMNNFDFNLKPSKKIEQKIIEFNNTSYVYIYTVFILKKRWIEGERILFNFDYYNRKSDFHNLFDYIKKFKIKNIKLDQKFIDVFKLNYKTAIKYATVINAPFPEGEQAIAKSYNASFTYATKILKQRFPLGENKILKSKKAEKYKNIFKIK